MNLLKRWLVFRLNRRGRHRDNARKQTILLDLVQSLDDLSPVFWQRLMDDGHLLGGKEAPLQQKLTQGCQDLAVAFGKPLAIKFGGLAACFFMLVLARVDAKEPPAGDSWVCSQHSFERLLDIGICIHYFILFYIENNGTGLFF